MVRETAFDDVFDSQTVFRILLNAMSRPGVLVPMKECAYRSQPAGFLPPVLSIMKTLCDHRVSFSLGSAGSRPDWVRYLEVNLATPFRGPSEADYVIFDGAGFEGDFSLLKRGTLEFPESSATALLCVGRLESQPAELDSGVTLLLSGPGVKTSVSISVSGLDPRYLEERARANRFYPLGIDIFLVDERGRVAGIPRTSKVGEG